MVYLHRGEFVDYVVLKSNMISNDEELIQIPHPALKTKKDITKYINWRQFTKDSRWKPNEQLSGQWGLPQLQPVTFVIPQKHIISYEIIKSARIVAEVVRCLK